MTPRLESTKHHPAFQSLIVKKDETVLFKLNPLVSSLRRYTKGPPVHARYKPEKAHHHDLPPVKTYHPTEEEWAGDPLAYIAKIRPEAEQYGVCNIVAPASWNPEFCLPNKDALRFRTRIQAINELQNRPAGREGTGR